MLGEYLQLVYMFSQPAWPVGFQGMSARVEDWDKAMRGLGEFEGEDPWDTVEIGQREEPLRQVV